MELTAKLETFKAYAEKLGLTVEATESEYSAYIVVRDPSVVGGWLQITAAKALTGSRPSHGAYVSWVAAGKPRKATLRSCYGIIQQFAGH